MPANLPPSSHTVHTSVSIEVELSGDECHHILTYNPLNGDGDDLTLSGGAAMTVVGRKWASGSKMSPFAKHFSRVGLPFPRDFDGNIDPVLAEFKSLWWIENGKVNDATVKRALDSQLWRLSTYVFQKGTLLVFIVEE